MSLKFAVFSGALLVALAPGAKVGLFWRTAIAAEPSLGEVHATTGTIELVNSPTILVTGQQVPLRLRPAAVASHGSWERTPVEPKPIPTWWNVSMIPIPTTWDMEITLLLERPHGPAALPASTSGPHN